MPYYVYILLCRDDSLYTGISTDIKRRFAEHKDKKGGHYTASRGVKKIVFSEKFPDRSSALKREAEIKNFRREKKIFLIKITST